MKNAIWILVVLLGIWGCDDDDSVFNSSIPRENISFKAVPGGAIMYYNLKGSKDVFSIRAQYTDAMGETLTVDGTYLSDSLELVGFNEARQNMPVYVSLLNNKQEESEKMELSFSTEDSAPAAFFKSVEVVPGWGGFQVNYDAPATTGYAHIFYLGESPLTHEPDTIWLGTITITEGHNSFIFSLQQEKDYNTVIITTEDFRGYRVNRRVWENVESYAMALFPSANISVLDPCEIVTEDETLKMGSKYLFDGDTRGEQRRGADNPSRQYCMFGAGPNALGQYWILDLGEARMIAKLRMYASYAWETFEYGWYWNGGRFYDRFPNEVTIYGSNDPEDDTSWEQLAYFYQSPLVPGWAEKSRTVIKERAILERAEPIYIDIACIANGKGYRYIKMVPHNTFLYTEYANRPNKNNAVALSELEVYVKKD